MWVTAPPANCKLSFQLDTTTLFEIVCYIAEKCEWAKATQKSIMPGFGLHLLSLLLLLLLAAHLVHPAPPVVLHKDIDLQPKVNLRTILWQCRKLRKSWWHDNQHLAAFPILVLVSFGGESKTCCFQSRQKRFIFGAVANLLRVHSQIFDPHLPSFSSSSLQTNHPDLLHHLLDHHLHTHPHLRPPELMIAPGATVPNPDPADQPDSRQRPSGSQAGRSSCPDEKWEKEGLDQISKMPKIYTPPDKNYQGEIT